MKKQKEQHVPAVSRLRHVANFIQHQKQRFADFLSERYNQLSQSGKKISLLLFGVVMGSISVCLMINSGKPANALAEATAKLPVVIPEQSPEPLITVQEYQQLMSFRHAMDSLHAVNPVLYDNLIHERQGLLDSLDLLINLYHRQ